MSIFNELLPEIKEISNSYAKNFEIDLQKAYEALDKFGEDYKNGRNRTRETIKNKTNTLNTLQSINEDEVESNKLGPQSKIPIISNNKEVKPAITTKPSDNAVTSSTESKPEAKAKKRGKDMIDGATTSPEMDKRQKRNASVKAQNQISKQVNVNLSQKMRREDTSTAIETDCSKRESRSRSRRNKDDDKENSEPTEPIPVSQIKQEKVSLPMSAPAPIPQDTPIKQEIQDDIAMPPPTAPIPKPRRVKEKLEDKESGDETSTRKTRNKKSSVVPRASSRSTRSTRGSAQVSTNSVQESQPTVQEPKATVQEPKSTVQEPKATVQEPKATVQEPKATVQEPKETIEVENTEQQVTTTKQEVTVKDPQMTPEPRPKRTRAKRKQNEMEQEKKLEKEASQDSAPSSPERSRPKRTRKAPQKLLDQAPTPKEADPPKPTKESPKEPLTTSPILENNNKLYKQKLQQTKTIVAEDITISKDIQIQVEKQSNETTEVLVSAKEMEIQEAVVTNGLNETVVLPNGKYDHAPNTPKAVNMNATVVLERATRSTLVLDNPIAVNETVVIDKCGSTNTNMTEDDSIMTDDNSDVMTTPPRPIPNNNNPPSAVKEKVQQFEEMASRVTRNKTRAMTKMDDVTSDSQTPPDKVIPKNVLSSDTLAKMNSMIFNGKTPLQSSQSATKLTNPYISSTSKTASTSKLSAVSKLREQKDEEDPRKKKKQMLEERIELQKRKREEKIAAAEAARTAAERERQTALEIAERERKEKQDAVILGRMERQKEAERHRKEVARKAAITEERRRQAEMMREEKQQALKKADNERRRQLEEAERTKKEAEKVAREMEKRKKEYIEKQKMKQKIDKVNTPLKNDVNARPMEPVYMADGFQHLNSDSDDEAPRSHVVPTWSQRQNRFKQLQIQLTVRQSLIDRLFSIRTHSPDLREIFPNIDARALKRTSSAVWRTPRATERN